MNGLDAASLSFSATGVLVLQCILALVIFGVALELSFADFKRLLSIHEELVHISVEINRVPVLMES